MKNIENQIKKLRDITGLDIQIPEDFSDEFVPNIENLLQAYQNSYSYERIFTRLLKQDMDYTEFQYISAKMHIDENAPMCLFLIHSKSQIDEMILEMIRSIFPYAKKDFILPIDKSHILIIHRIPFIDHYALSKYFNENTKKQIEDYIGIRAKEISDLIHSEGLISTHLAYSGLIQNIFELAKYYKETDLALRIMLIFYPNRLVSSSDKLGLAGLIYNLPLEACERFLNEYFKGNVFSLIDEETRLAISTFLNNNLSLAETARKLHMHRNTLVYRFEILEKQTGIDIRSFEGASIYNIAGLLYNYINYMKKEI